MIRIAGGTVLTTDGWVDADVLLAGDRIAAIGDDLAAETVVDASGCLVGPGFVDLHTHLREPGQTWKEDIESGARAAVAGGFTAIVAMPNTDPPMDSLKVISQVVARGEAVGLVDVVPAASLTIGRAGTTPVAVEELHRAGVRIFTDDGDSVADPDVLARVMEAIARCPGAIVAQHAEDRSRTGDGHMHEGEVSRALGIGGLPSAAESDIVARDLQLVSETGAHYHCQHVSSKMTLEVIRRAKEEGLPVTAEVTPHHLTFDDSAIDGLDPNFKMYPPLRSDDDRLALIDGLHDGTIDAVATDHAPHAPEEKAVSFEEAPRGVIGLETAASATWEVLGEADRFFSALSSAPARIAGLDAHGHPLGTGSPANIVVFDPAQRWVASTFASRSSNSPYRGREMRGAVRATIHQGQLVYQIGVTTA